MAADKKDKKRKAATASAAAVADPPSKKSKKSTAKHSKPAEEATKPTAPKVSKLPKDTNGALSETAPALKVDGEQARQVKPRKRAVDFLSDDDNDNEPTEEPHTSLKSEKPKKKKAKQEAESMKEKKTVEDKKPKEAKNVPDEASDEEDEDDQTTALIRGFESSGEEDVSGDEGFAPGQAVPAVPDSKQLKRKMRRMKKTSAEPEEPGTVYVGRIPHGFYEHEMRAYFSQFGPITRLRISRNRTTGRSKHYAFIEFSSSSVAKIVADTMDNYLMFGHILKCKYVPQEQVHSALWKGANRRFKKTPWNRIEKRRLEESKTRDQWSKKIEREEAQRSARAEKMKELGYEFEMPKLKSVDEVPAKSAAVPAIKESEQAKTLAIEGPSKEEDKSGTKEPSKKSKKEKKPASAVNGAKDDVPKEKENKKDKNQSKGEDSTTVSEKKSKKASDKVQNGAVDAAAKTGEEKVSDKAEKKAAKKAERKGEEEGGKHKSKKSKA